MLIKSQLIGELSKKFPHLPEKDIALAVNHIIEHMSGTLSEGGRIEIRGFGSFVVKEYQAYQGRNPKTGETSMEPQRVKMIAGPDGMPLDLPTVKESVNLVPIDNFEMPSETKSGIPLDPKTGTPKVRDISKLPVPGTRGLIDPSTGKPMTMGSVWGDELSGLGNRQQGKAAISNKHMNKTEAVQRLMSEE